jgi:predicted HTH domain antitoxin
MNPTLTIALPDTPAMRSLSNEEARKELAVALYAKRAIGGAEARRLAGLDKPAFNQLLAEHGVDDQFGVEDYEADLATMRELGWR